MKKILVAMFFIALNALVLTNGAHAQAAPQLNPSLKKAATLIPIPGISGAVNDLFNQLKPLGSGGKYAASTKVNVPGVGDFPLQLYVFGELDRQAIILVVNRTIAMPGVFNNSAWKKLAGSSLTDPIFSLSLGDYSLNTMDMPAEFRQVVANSYFNVDSLDFTSGLQVASRAHIGGVMKTVIETGMGVPVQQFTMRAGVVSPAPSNPQAAAGLAAAMLSDLENVGKMAKDAPEFFAEFQLAPGKSVPAPLGMQAMTLTDATFSINNKGTAGYKGNAVLPGGKKLITFFETPLNPLGAMDLLDFRFGMAAQDFTLEDYVNLATAFSTPKMQGGSFLKGIDKFEAQLRSVLKPLAVFKLRNPKPVPEYKFGDKSKPFPPLEVFNVLMLGPLASADDGTGKTINGPMLKLVGDASVLGQKLASMNAMMSANGLHAKASAGLSLKLGPLGKQGITMAANADIDGKQQLIGLRGNVVGRVLEANMDGLNLSINSPATCLTPFALSAKLAIDPNMDFASVLDGMPGVNVDPAQLQGCVGAELEKAYKWVATTGSSLGGYTAAAANQELNKIANAAAREYERLKDIARDKANKTASDAMKAFNDAGNAFKKIGKKKHHKAPPDPRMEASVFDWDYYYDTNQDVVKTGVDLAQHWRDNGISAGRRGSPEFDVKFYMARYLDVQKACGTDRLCAVKHWVDNGIDEGRQGSVDFAVASYLQRYPDLQKSFGQDNYPEALDHWMNDGSVKGRNGKADNPAPGPINGPKQIGGDGGSRWNDYDKCAGQFVTGFKVFYGDRLDMVQFHYNGRGWAGVHGKMNTPRAEVMLAAGEYIVRVDYRSGARVDSVTFKSNLGKTYGPYGGGGGSPGTYIVTPGEKLGCMAGRSGSEIDKLLFSSTGLR
ncbi:MAG: lectin [Burkholderiales bacterium]|nr:lectin [Burkholderiales bacterium]